MADLTPEIIAQLAKLDREATPGDWTAENCWLVVAEEPGDVRQRILDADLIALMRNALPALLAAARREARLREALERVLPFTTAGREDCRAALAYDGKEEP